MAPDIEVANQDFSGGVGKAAHVRRFEREEDICFGKQGRLIGDDAGACLLVSLVRQKNTLTQASLYQHLQAQLLEF